MRDESGVAMAYTILAFSFFFMLCVSVYAMAENVRQKMELQNACDAAAYSGAVVQADMLSRLAVLNRALAWTYVETNKRHMDYTVDDWLQRTVREYDRIADAARAVNNRGNCGKGGNGSYCSCGTGWRGLCWFAGANGQPAHVRLNSKLVFVGLIRNQMGRAYSNEYDNIINGYKNIAILNTEINTIRKTVNQSIGKAVDGVMGQQSSKFDAYDYHLDGDWKNTAAASYIEPQTNEEQFVNYTNTTRSDSLGNGLDVWWRRISVGSDWWDGGGFARNYVHAGSSLCSSGNAEGYMHWHSYGLAELHSCKSDFYTGNFEETGRRLLNSTPAAPAKLSKSFFGANGSIIVAAKRRMINPFSALFGNSAALDGLYGAFNGSGNDMWVVSASRAGIRFGEGGTKAEDPGNYHILYPGDTNDLPK